MTKKSFFARAFVATNALIILGLTLGCDSSSRSPSSSLSSVSDNDPSGITPGPGAEKGICTTLNFSGFSWPNNLFEFEKEALQLGLNITGTFEGRDGWENLTNDFDAQGMSMGLMNQNLGTGSLQPLLVIMRDQHFAKFRSLFQPDHFQSILAMLSNWESTKAFSTTAEVDFSPLDINNNEDGQANESTSGSVEWARKTLYDSPGVFNPIWKKELKSLASSTEYVGLQINAAWDLHQRALRLHRFMAVYELRTYLLMFDIVVQNGNLKPQDEIEYRDFVSKNPRATATQRLQKIVDLRLRWVKPQFRKDVQSRKMSLIHGSGLVHGRNRQYEKEYCFNRRQSFPRRSVLP